MDIQQERRNVSQIICYELFTLLKQLSCYVNGLFILAPRTLKKICES